MKVGLAVYEDLSVRSGGYLFDRMMAKHLLDRGDEVEVVTIPGRANTLSWINNLNPALFQLLSRLDVDVLVEDELCHGSLFLLNTRLKREIDYPLIGLFHYLACRADPTPASSHRHEIAERKFIASLDGCIFNSEGTKEAARSLTPVPSSVVAKPGRDHILPKDTVRTRSEALRILYLGNIAPDKGLHVLIASLASLPHGRFVLEVGGPITDPHYFNMVSSMIERYDLGGQVRFWGWVPGQERERLMASADVLVVPSCFEGYGLVIVEAMAYGLPAIVPLAGGAAEITSPGREGFLVASGDHAAIAQRLAELQRNHERLEEMSKQARRRYDELPTWSEEMEKVRAFLQRSL